MKALLLKAKGQWDSMSVEEIDTPSPGKGEVLVKIHAAGLNPVDYKTATNGNPNWEYPHILGLDGAGIIEQVGDEVTEWKAGDRVVYHGDLMRKGTFAQYAIAQAHTISQLPESISFVHAAAIPTAGYTAYQALFRKLHIHRGQTILIHAGAGGVGGYAIQMAKYMGLTVITTASRHNHDFVKKLGADYAIDYKEEDFVDQTVEITNGIGVHAVLDTVSSDNATKSLDTLTFNGQMAYIAGAPDFAQGVSFARPLSFHQIALGGVYQSSNTAEQADLAMMGDEMINLLLGGYVDPMIKKTISLEEIPQALVELSERHVTGKIVAEIEHE
ncbi:zinc-binding dehydrogenase [Alkalihalobacillus hwajinpoensis]|uniref:zinc-binding dehydrogenase n=1 Tax=Guptibacillus hwajinpoensis TaxID=208199 RepID=UPI001883AAEE|nr:zinc-binding dehydrogenase [Pseudalkalibacillus hwajinpoensis]MBF0707366.1 zinc-binding dehydrogenase [Pseudalkalibacillus hwajinpoensis]